MLQPSRLKCRRIDVSALTVCVHLEVHRLTNVTSRNSALCQAVFGICNRYRDFPIIYLSEGALYWLWRKLAQFVASSEGHVGILDRDLKTSEFRILFRFLKELTIPHHSSV